MLIDLSKYGLTYEPTVQDSIRKGADVVCFSGDKLLGGPQAGIIIGKKKYIDQMKKNQLTRALRIDKFTAAALELVLQEYLSEEKAIQNLPVLRMITESKADVEKRARSLKRILHILLQRSGWNRVNHRSVEALFRLNAFRVWQLRLSRRISVYRSWKKRCGIFLCQSFRVQLTTRFIWMCGQLNPATLRR